MTEQSKVTVEDAIQFSKSIAELVAHHQEDIGRLQDQIESLGKIASSQQNMIESLVSKIERQ